MAMAAALMMKMKMMTIHSAARALIWDRKSGAMTATNNKQH